MEWKSFQSHYFLEINKFTFWGGINSNSERLNCSLCEIEDRCAKGAAQSLLEKDSDFTPSYYPSQKINDESP